jgi:hypothetical protein
VQILLDNNKISNYSIIDEGMNTLGYENLNEVFFDVYEIKSNGLDLVKEKKGEFAGNPIIEVDLKIEDKIYKNVRFVLTKENKIRINPKFLDHTKVFIQENIQKGRITKTVKPIKPKELPVIKENKVPKKQNPILIEKNLIEETKNIFFESIRGEVLEEIKKEVRAGIIADLIKENLQSNFDSVIQDNGNKNKLQRILENFNNSFRKEFIELAEKVSRREAMRYVESGGGTNAVQYANGGTMNGDLTVAGSLHIDSIINSNGDSFTAKVVKDISGNDFVDAKLSINHNLNTYDLGMTLYYINLDGTREVAYASIVNDTPNTTQIIFSNQPASTENFKLIITY